MRGGAVWDAIAGKTHEDYIADAEKCIEENPNDHKAWLQRGLHLKVMLLKANDEIYSLRMKLEAAKGYAQEAFNSFQKALEINAADAETASLIRSQIKSVHSEVTETKAYLRGLDPEPSHPHVENMEVRSRQQLIELEQAQLEAIAAPAEPLPESEDLTSDPQPPNETVAKKTQVEEEAQLEAIHTQHTVVGAERCSPEELIARLASVKTSEEFALATAGQSSEMIQDAITMQNSTPKRQLLQQFLE